MAKDWTQEAAFELLEAENELLKQMLDDGQAGFEMLAEENRKLRAALATVLGTRTHGMNMTWEERIRIGRAALDGQPAPGKEEA